MNKLKILPLAICCFVISLCSETRSMDALSDQEEKISYKVQSCSQNEVDSLVVLEDSATSWASYLISPVKANIQMAYDVVHYVVQNPKNGIIIALCLSSHVAAVAAQFYDCRCYFDNNGGQKIYWSLVGFSEENCERVCGLLCNGTHVTYGTNPIPYESWACHITC